MPRYFLHLAYHGGRYSGWQRQPHSPSVQQALEETLATIVREPIELVGCGRTDAGVHASQYVAHVDLTREPPRDLLRRLNRMLPADIAVRAVESVGPTPPRGEHGRHARFSAKHRAYRYDIVGEKDPFRAGAVWVYPFFDRLALGTLNEAASALLAYGEFAPFCKTHSDARTMRCDVRRSEWVVRPEGGELHYHIAADRFLRGMVRLIVGACIQVARGDMTLGELHAALETQEPLPRPLSVPPDGLYLTEVQY